jgi:NTP pyrophosphatase (non-canonical NTP hydrolase)
MEIKEFQKKVDKWTGQFTPQYWSPHEILARAIEEVGELAREVNACFGPKKKKPGENEKELGDEIADVIFTLACLANSQNIDLSEHLQRIIDKCYIRDNNRFNRKKK